MRNIAIATLLALGSTRAWAQDAQLKGAAVQLISYADLKSDAVQTIALVPGYHMVIEFPYPVARLDVGDTSVFSVDKYANKLTVKAKSPVAKETSVTISMADADLTVIPFIFRVDPHAPRVQILRYTDPLERQLDQARSGIRRELETGEEARVSELAEKRLVQRLLLASAPTQIGRESTVSGREGDVKLRVESVQQMPGPDGRPKVYIRYRLENFTARNIEDLKVEVSATRSSGAFWGKEVNTPYYDIDEFRTANSVRSGAAILGILSLDTPLLKEGETLSVVAVFNGGKSKVTVDGVLTGTK